MHIRAKPDGRIDPSRRHILKRRKTWIFISGSILKSVTNHLLQINPWVLKLIFPRTSHKKRVSFCSGVRNPIRHPNLPKGSLHNIKRLVHKESRILTVNRIRKQLQLHRLVEGLEHTIGFRNRVVGHLRLVLGYLIGPVFKKLL